MLDLNNDNLQTCRITIIAQVLKRITALVELDVGSNIITDYAADDVASVVLYNTKLQVFNLSGRAAQRN